ncbi:hypothetical protein [Alteribacter keqinensis]|uniref:Uncharacterized protein n=1 Tax=Alteribacter keqinensis TaxID=2483800 RepID=A0A3M7TT04_9BACI|nr:hypothetical protein [Alteribacter keqinensis]RNA68573.1 hypothetical protein EBO34_00975 [Alteribacter keqinensis]
MEKWVVALTILSLHVFLSGYAHIEKEVAAENCGVIETMLHITVEDERAEALMDELPDLFNSYASYEVWITEEEGFTTVSMTAGLYETDIAAALSHYETEIAGYSSAVRKICRFTMLKT